MSILLEKLQTPNATLEAAGGTRVHEEEGEKMARCACRGSRVRAERASKNVRNVLHLPDGLSAEASEGVGRDALDVAVLLDVPEQHAQRRRHVQAHFSQLEEHLRVSIRR